MSFNITTRRAVLQKYYGHCAYCGKPLDYTDMQVDHLIPQCDSFIFEGGEYNGIQDINDFANLMPSCRRCNHYKRAHTIETFRRYIEEIPFKLRNDYIYKVGLDYGMIEEHEHHVKFYFEKFEEERDDSPSQT